MVVFVVILFFLHFTLLSVYFFILILRYLYRDFSLDVRSVFHGSCSRFDGSKPPKMVVQSAVETREHTANRLVWFEGASVDVNQRLPLRVALRAPFQNRTEEVCRVGRLHLAEKPVPPSAERDNSPGPPKLTPPPIPHPT